MSKKMYEVGARVVCDVPSSPSYEARGVVTEIQSPQGEDWYWVLWDGNNGGLVSIYYAPELRPESQPNPRGDKVPSNPPPCPY